MAKTISVGSIVTVKPWDELDEKLGSAFRHDYDDCPAVSSRNCSLYSNEHFKLRGVELEVLTPDLTGSPTKTVKRAMHLVEGKVVRVSRLDGKKIWGHSSVYMSSKFLNIVKEGV